MVNPSISIVFVGLYQCIFKCNGFDKEDDIYEALLLLNVMELDAPQQ